MCQYQHGIIVDDILAYMIFFQNFSVWNLPYNIGTFRVHQIHIEIFAPSMLFNQFQMRLGMITNTRCGISVGGVALYDRAVYFIYHRFPELRPQKILISLLARMNLHRYFAGQIHTKSPIKFYHLFRCDFPGKINFRLHLKTSLLKLITEKSP